MRPQVQVKSTKINQQIRGMTSCIAHIDEAGWISIVGPVLALQDDGSLCPAVDKSSSDEEPSGMLKMLQELTKSSISVPLKMWMSAAGINPHVAGIFD